MATVTDFFLGARPKTLTAAIAPVSIGSALAIAEDNYSWDLIIGCLIVAVALQIGVNYANDYSDGIKGTDSDRVGPMRLVGSGRATPKSVLVAMVIAFLVASSAGIYVSLKSSPYLILVGIACVVLAYLYTGTKYAYGYVGLGELVVLLCFGFVATIGTYFVNTQEVSFLIIVASLIPGFYSVAILLANNIRDIETDKVSNKKTLAVRIGKKNAVGIFTLVVMLIPIVVAVIGVTYPMVFIALFFAASSVLLVSKIHKAQSPKDFISILIMTSMLNLIVSITVSVLVVLS